MDDQQNIEIVEDANTFSEPLPTVVDNIKVEEVDIGSTDKESPTEDVVEESDREESHVQKKPNKIDGKTRINQLTRAKYVAESIARNKEIELDQLRQEVDRLKKLSDHSSQAALTHYDDSIKMRREQARMKLNKAIEEGNVKEQEEALDELTKAHSQQAQVDSWKASQQYINSNKNESQEYYQQPIAPTAPQPVEVNMNQETHDWVSENPWFNPNSDSFNPELYQEVVSYASVLENKFRRTGREDKIMSKEYFDDIDNYVRSEIYGESESTQPRTLSMKQTRTSVAPVNAAGNLNRINSTKFTLPEGMKENEFKSFIKNLGVSEKDYLANLQKDIRGNDRLIMELSKRRGIA